MFIDKVAERMAYERGGTRLYDAALVKVAAMAAGTPVTMERVKQIRNQEVEHAELLRQALIDLGADPTAQTPCADLVGCAVHGTHAVGHRSAHLVAQTLSSLLAAELIDVASWEMLVTGGFLWAGNPGRQFDKTAREQEESHLETVSRAGMGPHR